MSVSRQLIELTRRAFRAAGVEVRRHQPDEAPRIDYADIFNALIALRDNIGSPQAPEEELGFLDYCIKNAALSRAQLMQDLFVLYHLQNKRQGYFVEFGATDGVTINNTVLLEREFGWTGILAEPARAWHEPLRANRTCAVNTGCVWHTSGKTLLFNQTPDKEYSTIDELSGSDYHADRRVHGERYAVATVSLLDLLDQNDAPSIIDYLSIDTEGSEFEILNAFDFRKYDVQVITVEHNYTANRGRLYDLLVGSGYTRKFKTLSQWDDWYVRQ